MLAAALAVITAAKLHKKPEPPTVPAVPSTESTSEAGYKSPKNFTALQKQNPDIYAWLEIPGTVVSYPVYQREGDDKYYLRRDINGEYDINGVLFTEGTYNKKDFSDAVNIIYGHSMTDGSMFGSLQIDYSSDAGLKEYSQIIVYLPEKELHYTVFAAVPYDSRHILYNYDFENKRIFNLFIDSVLSVRDLQAHFNAEETASYGEKVLILSTCLEGNRNRRFLVLARLNNDEQNSNQQ